MEKDRYSIGGIIGDPARWELLEEGWMIAKETGSLYHSHSPDKGSCEEPFYYVSNSEFKCRVCGAEPPAGVKFHAKFVQLNNI